MGVPYGTEDMKPPHRSGSRVCVLGLEGNPAPTSLRGPPRVELRLRALFVRFEFSFELAFGNGEIDYKTESVRDLPSR
jgi:hypothetical protein